MHKVFRIKVLMIAFLIAFTLLSVIGCGSNGKKIAINEKNFPDQGLRKSLLSYDKYCDNDGKLNEAEVLALDHLILDDVKDLTGLEHLSSLKAIEIRNCTADELRFGNVPNLNNLVISKGCSVKKLNLSQNTNIVKLICKDISLEELSLPSNSSLGFLVCSDNKLTNIEFNGCNDLRYAVLEGNDLDVVDISNCPKLMKVVESNSSRKTTNSDTTKYINGMDQISIESDVVIIMNKSK